VLLGRGGGLGVVGFGPGLCLVVGGLLG
jgi:hypothetical protein